MLLVVRNAKVRCGMGFAGFKTEINLPWKSARCILSTIRRFLLFTFFSTHAIVIVALLDHFRHGDVVERLFAFEKETNVRPLDLQYWNYFNRYSRWNPLCVAMVFCWLPILLVVSVPGVTKRCVESLYPSRYFAFLRHRGTSASVARETGRTRQGRAWHGGPRGPLFQKGVLERYLAKMARGTRFDSDESV